MRKSPKKTQNYLLMHALARGYVCHNNRTHGKFYLSSVLLLLLLCMLSVAKEIISEVDIAGCRFLPVDRSVCDLQHVDVTPRA